MLHLWQQVEKEGGDVNRSENTVKYSDWENRIATPWRFKAEEEENYFNLSQNYEFEKAKGTLKHEPQSCLSSEQALRVNRIETKVGWDLRSSGILRSIEW